MLTKPKQSVHAMPKLFSDSAQCHICVLFKKEEIINSVSHLVEINHLLHANSFGSDGSMGWKREPGSPPLFLRSSSHGRREHSAAAAHRTHVPHFVTKYESLKKYKRTKERRKSVSR